MKVLSLLVGTLAVLGPHDIEGSAATSAALGTLKNMDYRFFVAGGTCAAFSHGITTPIDVVKTKIQSNPKVSSWRGEKTNRLLAHLFFYFLSFVSFLTSLA